MNPFGAAAAADVLVAYIEAELPAMLAKARTAYAVALEALPDPKLVTSAELPEVPVDAWPAVMVVPERLIGLNGADINPSGQTVYTARYRLAIETYVRAQGFEATGAMNRRYASTIAALLVRDPTCKVSNVWAASYPRIDVTTIEANYLPTVSLSASRTIASSRTSFELTLLECPAALGHDPALVATTHVDSKIIGPTVPMPTHP